MIPFGFFTPFLLFVAFLLLLLVTLSVPIIKTIFLWRLSVGASSGLLNSSVADSVTFGVWGYCTTGASVSVVGIHHNTAAECSPHHLGYTFDGPVPQARHVSGIENTISRSLTGALALNIVVVVLTFITLLISLFMLRRGRNGTSRLPSLLALGAGLLTALLTTILFLIDVILVALVRNRVKKDTHGSVNLNWGNAVWMTLAATVLLWIATVGACAGVCGGNRRRVSENEKY